MLLEIEPDPILFLKTYDRESGKPKTNPVPFRTYGNQFVIVAWNESIGKEIAGKKSTGNREARCEIVQNQSASYKPDWYLNLKEEPIVEIEIAGEEKFAIASTPTGADRLEILPLISQLSQEVERHLPRNITGVLLTPIE